MYKQSISVLAALSCISSPATAAYPSDESAAISQAIADFDRVGSKSHPRFLRAGTLGEGTALAARNERKEDLQRVIDKLERNGPISDTDLSRFRNGTMDTDLWWKVIRPYSEQTAEAAFAWYIRTDKRSTLINEVTERLRRLAPIVEDKCTNQQTVDFDISQSREFVFDFALAYDFAYEGLQQADRTLIADAITACARSRLPALAEEVRNNKTSSTTFQSLAKYSAAMLLVRGDADFTTLDGLGLTTNAVWSYVWKLPNFGGEDGGYDHGSSYFLWGTSESVVPWDVIARVLNYPLYDKKYVYNLPHFLAWTMPPQSAAGAFGDGAEVNRFNGEADLLGRAIMSRYTGLTAADSAGTISRWWTSKVGAGDVGRLEHLLSPRASSLAASEPTLRSKRFDSVGIAAFHSSLSNPLRTSVLFRSSPKGSLNHAHMDQNSFVIYHRGQVMAMDSGLYISYNDPHWQNWYKKTVAHNAITYNGTGQETTGGTWGSATSTGRITRFNPDANATDGIVTSPTNKVRYDVVTGDATAAYGENVAKAERTLVYLRDSATVVVIDQLVAGKVGVANWEYNFHSPKIGEPYGTPVKTATASRIEQRFVHTNTTMCLKVHAPTLLTQNQTPGYGAYPPKPDPSTVPPHYWNKFSYQNASANGAFVSIIRLDCTAPLDNDVVSFANGVNVKLGTNIEINLTSAGVFSVK